ncbi:MAG: hypothetical protein HQ518_25420 [Rhodopirellula sp.]|nr:hypothetical protein [Rhodopirellula sp.]
MKTTTTKEIRRGLIIARIRCVRARDGIRHTVSVHRLFRNGDHWKESSRFGQDDLPVVRLVLDLAHTWVLQNGTQNEQQTARRTSNQSRSSR